MHKKFFLLITGFASSVVVLLFTVTMNCGVEEETESMPAPPPQKEAVQTQTPKHASVQEQKPDTPDVEFVQLPGNPVNPSGSYTAYLSPDTPDKFNIFIKEKKTGTITQLSDAEMTISVQPEFGEWYNDSVLLIIGAPSSDTTAIKNILYLVDVHTQKVHIAFIPDKGQEIADLFIRRGKVTIEILSIDSNDDIVITEIPLNNVLQNIISQ